MSDYEHEIFISYRRSDPDWVRWTLDYFVKPLRSLLRPALGDVKIFVDSQIETGNSWPAHLARAHSRSKLIIPILSRDYFNSDWCRLELALMHHREQCAGFRTPGNPSVLILPFVIDDGDCFPPEVQDMQGEPIHDFASPWNLPNTPKHELFAEKLRLWCPRVQSALDGIPAFDPTWEQTAQEQFKEAFRIHVAKQKTLPGLFLLPIGGTAPAP